MPIWLTVKVPADAKPGLYTGQVTIEVKGEKSLVVPVNLQIADFVVPDTQDYKTWIELMQSPDTLAAEYKVRLWSDKHWELISQSMSHIAEIGSRVVIVPLIAQTNSGNSESMVRWIEKDDGSYDYDLTIVDKYLDTAVKCMGKPKFTVFTAWEIYLATPKKEVADPDPKGEAAWLAARWNLRGKGPAATALDPKTGRTSTFNLPRFEEANALAAWKPLFDRLHWDMAKRGIENTMLLGMTSDMWPNKDEMVTLDKASGSLPWINHSHQGPRGAKLAGGLGNVVYTAYVWPNEYPGDPKQPRMYGWKRPELNVEFRRFGAFNEWMLPTQMIVPELEITGRQRGLGRHRRRLLVRVQEQERPAAKLRPRQVSAELVAFLQSHQPHVESRPQRPRRHIPLRDASGRGTALRGPHRHGDGPDGRRPEGQTRRRSGRQMPETTRRPHLGKPEGLQRPATLGPRLHDLHELRKNLLLQRRRLRRGTGTPAPAGRIASKCSTHSLARCRRRRPGSSKKPSRNPRRSAWRTAGVNTPAGPLAMPSAPERAPAGLLIRRQFAVLRVLAPAR